MGLHGTGQVVLRIGNRHRAPPVEIVSWPDASDRRISGEDIKDHEFSWPSDCRW